MTIVIDSTTYDVDIIDYDRKPQALYKYAERTEDGTLHSELIGWYYNYDIRMGMSKMNVSDYAALFTKLTEAVSSHTITFEGSTFNCYFANVQDKAVKIVGATTYYRGLSFSVIRISPNVVPA